MSDSVKKDGSEGRQAVKKEKDKKKGCAKKGKNSRRCARYSDRLHRETNKLKRVIQSSGGDAAVDWAKSHEDPKKGVFLTGILKSLRTLKPHAFQRAVKKSRAFARAVGA